MLPALSEGCPPCRPTPPDRERWGEQILSWPLGAVTGLRCVRAVVLISCSGPRGGGRHVGGTRLAELFEGLKRCDQRSCGTCHFRRLPLEGRRKSMKPWSSDRPTSTSRRCATSSTSPTPQRGTEAGPSAAGRAHPRGDQPDRVGGRHRVPQGRPLVGRGAGVAVRASRADGTGETPAGGPLTGLSHPSDGRSRSPLFTLPPQWFRLLQRPFATA
jgi:hypothetical protein